MSCTYSLLIMNLPPHTLCNWHRNYSINLSSCLAVKWGMQKTAQEDYQEKELLSDMYQGAREDKVMFELKIRNY